MPKRRKGRKPVTRRLKKALRKYRDLKKTIQDPFLREQWDNSKTINQNFASLSFKSFASRLPKQLTVSMQQLSPQKKNIMTNLIQKHGQNYDKMANDIKVNVWQWTSTVCEKYAKLMLQNN